MRDGRVTQKSLYGGGCLLCGEADGNNGAVRSTHQLLGSAIGNDTPLVADHRSRLKRLRVHPWENPHKVRQRATYCRLLRFLKYGAVLEDIAHNFHKNLMAQRKGGIKT
jgi:hypothetical protein